MFDDEFIVIIIMTILFIICLTVYVFFLYNDVQPRSYEAMTVTERIMSEKLVSPW